MESCKIGQYHVDDIIQFISVGVHALTRYVVNVLIIMGLVV